jgi:hypothetical protein
MPEAVTISHLTISRDESPEGLPLSEKIPKNVATTKNCLSWQLVDVNVDGTFGHP